MLGELAAWAAAGDVRGEITVVVAGAVPSAAEPPAPDELADAVAEAEAAGMARRDAIAAVAKAHGGRKREVYDAVVRHRSSRVGR